MPVKFQCETIIITHNLAASRLHEIGGKTSYRLVNRGPGGVAEDCNWTSFKITVLLSTHTHRFCINEGWIWCPRPNWVRNVKNPIWGPGGEFESDIHYWKSIGFFWYAQRICYWILDLIFKAKLKLVSGNWKIQYGHQADVSEVTLDVGINKTKLSERLCHKFQILCTRPCLKNILTKYICSLINFQLNFILPVELICLHGTWKETY